MKNVVVVVLAAIGTVGIPALAISSSVLGDAHAEVGRAEWRALEAAERLEAAREAAELEAAIRRAGWKIER